MSTYNIDDENLINSKPYKDFMAQNPAYGLLSIRAFAANQAIPVTGLKIVVSTNIGNDTVNFFEGYTNTSGTIENISLPAPELDKSNLVPPIGTNYKITATYTPENITKEYIIKMYENIGVIQNISIVPNMKLGGL